MMCCMKIAVASDEGEEKRRGEAASYSVFLHKVCEKCDASTQVALHPPSLCVIEGITSFVDKKQ